MPSSSPEAPRAARRWRSPTTTPTWPSGQTPADRSASHRPAAEPSGSRPHTAASRSTACGPWRRASTPSDRWRRQCPVSHSGCGCLNRASRPRAMPRVVGRIPTFAHPEIEAAVDAALHAAEFEVVALDRDILDAGAQAFAAIYFAGDVGHRPRLGGSQPRRRRSRHRGGGRDRRRVPSRRRCRVSLHLRSGKTSSSSCSIGWSCSPFQRFRCSHRDSTRSPPSRCCHW